MGIVEAKKELYKKLKKKAGVTGAGITQADGEDRIIIFLTKPTNEIRAAIPKVYKGNKVMTEVRPMAKAMTRG